MTRRRLILVAAALLAAAGYLALSRRTPAPVPLPRLSTVGAFSLTDEQGRPFGLTRLQNRVSVLDFIFTSCAGPCPLMSARMRTLQDSLRDLADVQFVSFSVDPQTDTPAVLRDYGMRFGADTARWFFLTGHQDEMYRIIRTGFRLTAEADTEGILHSTKFVLLDRGAAIRGYYDSEDDSSLGSLMGAVRMLEASGE